MNTAFVTGSQVYGTPTEESDIDLVVLVSDEQYSKLVKLSNGMGENTGPRSYPQIRFGKLNLIALSDDVVWKAWRDATRSLEKIKPVSRDDAVAVIKVKVAEAQEADNVKLMNSIPDLGELE